LAERAVLLTGIGGQGTQRATRQVQRRGLVRKA
jgi:hypothetical protein